MRDAMGKKGSKSSSRPRESLEKRYGPSSTRQDQPRRTRRCLTDALSTDGYVATLRRGGPNSLSIQICQGTARSMKVLNNTLCCVKQKHERLLGVPIQRLSTIAAGGHVVHHEYPARPAQEFAQSFAHNRHALWSVHTQRQTMASPEESDPNRTGYKRGLDPGRNNCLHRQLPVRVA